MINTEEKKEILNRVATWFDKLSSNRTYALEYNLGSLLRAERIKWRAPERQLFADAAYAMVRYQDYVRHWCEHFRLTQDFERSAVALFREGRKDGLEDLLEPNILQALSEQELHPTNKERTIPEAIALFESIPVWVIHEWIKTFGIDKTKILAQSLNQRASFYIRANSLKMDAPTLRQQLLASGIDCDLDQECPHAILIHKKVRLQDEKTYEAGLFEIQDKSSQAAVLALDPRPLDRIWDVCAGAGGKALYAAALMKNKGSILTTDTRDKPLQELKLRARRAGAAICHTMRSHPNQEIKNFMDSFDKILLDVPCSGTGTWRRQPELKWRWESEDIDAFAKTQLEIMMECVGRLMPGGRLVYSTCSLQARENGDVIDAFLAENPDMKRACPDRYMMPHLDESDGFFIACLRKVKSK